VISNTKFKFLLTKNVSWILLAILFIFDSVVSYWAVVYRHGKEVDLLVAPLVEKYPILYFPIIPVLFIIIFIIEKIITYITINIFQKWKFSEYDIIERIILEAIVIYWTVGNSSGNLIFLLGFRVRYIWMMTTLIALPITLVYALFMTFQIMRLIKSK
jgi:hypothetical protein